MPDQTVLVVEAEQAIAEALEQALWRMGFRVAGLARTGEEAIEMAAQMRPDVVLVDLDLHGPIDSAQAATGIRAVLDVPLVYLGTDVDEQLWQKARAARPYACVAKPFHDAQLRAAIDVALTQHQAAQHLKHRESWLATTLDSIGNAVLSADGTGAVSSMNPLAEALTGWKREDALGRDLTTILGFAEDGLGAAADGAAARPLQKDILVRFAEGTLVAKDGRRIPVEYSGAPIRDARGTTAGSVWVLRDVGERKQLEARVEERRLYLEAVLGCAPDAIVTLDCERRIREWNQGAESLFGYSALEAMGRPLDELVAGPDPSKLERARGFTEQVLAGEPVPPTELVRYRKDGTAVEVIAAGSPIRLGHEVIGAVASYRDITDRKQAQNAAAQRSKELARSNAFLTALGHVGARVASTRDLDEVMQTLGTELKELEVLALVATLEADEHALCVRYTSIESPLLALGEKAVGHNMLGFRITPDNFPEWNTVVERREAALVPDPVSLVTRSLPHVMRATVERVFQLGGWTADVPAIWLPLAIGQRVIGALATWGSDLRESDVPALSVFASQVAVAVENARLYAAEREQAEDLRRTNQFILTLSQVAARLAGTSDPDQVMETLGAALKMLGLDCVIGILDADDQDVVIRYASMDSGALSLAERLVGFQLVGYRLRRELWSASDVVEDRRPLFAAEPLEATAALLPNIPRAVLERAMRVAGVAPDSKVIYLPLMIGDHVSGVMAVWGPNLRQEDMAPLSVFAGQVAAALANARLLTEQKQRTADLAHAGALLRTELAEREQAEAARRESRMRLRSILDANPDLVYLTDAVGTLLDANAALLKVLGLPLEQAQGRNALEFLVGEGRERIEQAADRLRAGEEVRGLELQARVASGEVRYYEVHAVPRTHEGTVAEIVNVARDITDRKQAEEALRASNELLTKVFSTTHLLIAYMDADFNFIRVNRAYAAADGREPESFEGKNHFDLYPSEENEAIFRGVVETGEPASFRAKPFEYAEHPERGLTHWDWDLVPVKDAQGAVQGLVLSLVDVTQRIQAEQELREERDFAQTLIGTAQAIVLVLDTQGRVVQFNPYLEEISGYSLEEVQGKDWFSTFLPARDQDWVRELFVQAVGDIQTLGNVNAMVTKDGQERQIEWYDKTLKDAKGNVVGLLAIGQDVTERRQAQAALQEMHTQLEQRVAERTRELATLYDVTALASESLDLKVTLQRSLERLLAAMPCSCGVLHLLDRAEGLLRLAAQQGLSSGLAAQLATLPAETGVLGSTLEQGQPLVISDLAAHALGEIAPAVREFTICVAAPVRARGTSVGLLHVFGRADEECSLEDLALLTSVADHVGIAVDNAWLQQRAEQAAVLEERERLGRELHDSITQALFGLSLYAELASDLLDSGEWERAAEELARIQVAAQQVLKDTRLLIYRMRPVLLEEEGLVEALRHRVAAVEGRAGIEARVVSEAVGDLPARLEEAFYYIAQEALNNAFRHAQASSVTVSVRGEGEHLLLEVADNGRGFDLDAVQALGGMGLGNMRQRAEQLGGTLAILSEPGRGTTVRAKVSLAAHTDPAQANHSRQTTKRRQGRD